MNTSSDWLAKLHTLVDAYAAARVVPLGGVVSADVATAAAWASIVQHVADHSSMASGKPSPAPHPNRAGGKGEE